MTTDEGIALARRAVACAGFRWLPGMLAVEQAVPGMALSARPVRVDDYWHDVGVWLPDLSDPATLGCLLALVREARREPVGFLVPMNRGGWQYHTRLYAGDSFAGDIEAEALVVALEAA